MYYPAAMPNNNIFTISTADSRYPRLLAQIADPPELLYCRGNAALLDTFCIGIVGTRNASEYGRQACRDMASTLASAGITIVSGLAAGIDTEAHKATLAAHGNTIAVFGNGIDDASVFPTDNLTLVHNIIDAGGLIISEYPEGTHGTKFTFPTRNRIISGLSRGILVVEADKKSGSLITAKLALDQNRDVFAIPGSIYWPRSVGTNWLIQQGARPVLTVADIFESYKLRQIPLPEIALSTGDPAQQAILAVLRENGPTHIDTIVARCGMDASRIMTAVTMLELSDTVRHMSGGTYGLNQ